ATAWEGSQRCARRGSGSPASNPARSWRQRAARPPPGSFQVIYPTQSCRWLFPPRSQWIGGGLRWTTAAMTTERRGSFTNEGSFANDPYAGQPRIDSQWCLADRALHLELDQAVELDGVLHGELLRN